MLTRKLTATLPEDVGYLQPARGSAHRPRADLPEPILSKRYFAATILESSLSLALMRSPHLAEVAERLRTVRSDVILYFVVTCARAKLVCVEIEQRFSGGRSEPARQTLASLATAAEAVRP